MNTGNTRTLRIALIGGVIVAAILILGTFWMGQSAKKDTVDAVRSVSLLYLDELAGRREQVVADNLNDNINKIRIAIGLMTEEDLSDIAHLQAYQARMNALFQLEKFAFVDRNGLIYTARGTQTDIDQYRFDHETLTAPEISVKNSESAENRVKWQELESRLALQEQLLEQQRQGEQQAMLITALSSDYWSVY